MWVVSLIDVHLMSPTQRYYDATVAGRGSPWLAYAVPVSRYPFAVPPAAPPRYAAPGVTWRIPARGPHLLRAGGVASAPARPFAPCPAPQCRPRPFNASNYAVQPPPPPLASQRRVGIAPPLMTVPLARHQAAAAVGDRSPSPAAVWRPAAPCRMTAERGFADTSHSVVDGSHLLHCDETPHPATPPRRSSSPGELDDGPSPPCERVDSDSLVINFSDVDSSTSDLLDDWCQGRLAGWRSRSKRPAAAVATVSADSSCLDVYAMGVTGVSSDDLLSPLDPLRGSAADCSSTSASSLLAELPRRGHAPPPPPADGPSPQPCSPIDGRTLSLSRMMGSACCEEEPRPASALASEDDRPAGEWTTADPCAPGETGPHGGRCGCRALEEEGAEEAAGEERENWEEAEKRLREHLKMQRRLVDQMREAAIPSELIRPNYARLYIPSCPPVCPAPCPAPCPPPPPAQRCPPPCRGRARLAARDDADTRSKALHVAFSEERRAKVEDEVSANNDDEDKEKHNEWYYDMSGVNAENGQRPRNDDAEDEEKDHERCSITSENGQDPHNDGAEDKQKDERRYSVTSGTKSENGQDPSNGNAEDKEKDHERRSDEHGNAADSQGQEAPLTNDTGEHKTDNDNGELPNDGNIETSNEGVSDKQLHLAVSRTSDKDINQNASDVENKNSGSDGGEGYNEEFHLALSRPSERDTNQNASDVEADDSVSLIETPPALASASSDASDEVKIENAHDEVDASKQAEKARRRSKSKSKQSSLTQAVDVVVQRVFDELPAVWLTSPGTSTTTAVVSPPIDKEPSPAGFSGGATPAAASSSAEVDGGSTSVAVLIDIDSVEMRLAATNAEERDSGMMLTGSSRRRRAAKKDLRAINSLVLPGGRRKRRKARQTADSSILSLNNSSGVLIRINPPSGDLVVSPRSRWTCPCICAQRKRKEAKFNYIALVTREPSQTSVTSVSRRNSKDEKRLSEESQRKAERDVRRSIDILEQVVAEQRRKTDARERDGGERTESGSEPDGSPEEGRGKKRAEKRGENRAESRKKVRGGGRGPQAFGASEAGEESEEEEDRSEREEWSESTDEDSAGGGSSSTDGARCDAMPSAEMRGKLGGQRAYRSAPGGTSTRHGGRFMTGGGTMPTDLDGYSLAAHDARAVTLVKTARHPLSFSRDFATDSLRLSTGGVSSGGLLSFEDAVLLTAAVKQRGRRPAARAGPPADVLRRHARHLLPCHLDQHPLLIAMEMQLLDEATSRACQSAGDAMLLEQARHRAAPRPPPPPPPPSDAQSRSVVPTEKLQPAQSMPELPAFPAMDYAEQPTVNAAVASQTPLPVELWKPRAPANISKDRTVTDKQESTLHRVMSMIDVLCSDQATGDEASVEGFSAVLKPGLSASLRRLVVDSTQSEHVRTAVQSCSNLHAATAAITQPTEKRSKSVTHLDRAALSSALKCLYVEVSSRLKSHAKLQKGLTAPLMLDPAPGKPLVAATATHRKKHRLTTLMMENSSLSIVDHLSILKAFITELYEIVSRAPSCSDAVLKSSVANVVSSATRREMPRDAPEEVVGVATRTRQKALLNFPDRKSEDPCESESFADVTAAPIATFTDVFMLDPSDGDSNASGAAGRPLKKFRNDAVVKSGYERIAHAPSIDHQNLVERWAAKAFGDCGIDRAVFDGHRSDETVTISTGKAVVKKASLSHRRRSRSKVVTSDRQLHRAPVRTPSTDSVHRRVARTLQEVVTPLPNASTIQRVSLAPSDAIFVDRDPAAPQRPLAPSDVLMRKVDVLYGKLVAGGVLEAFGENGAAGCEQETLIPLTPAELVLKAHFVDGTTRSTADQIIQSVTRHASVDDASSDDWSRVEQPAPAIATPTQDPKPAPAPAPSRIPRAVGQSQSSATSTRRPSTPERREARLSRCLNKCEKSIKRGMQQRGSCN